MVSGEHAPGAGRAEVDESSESDSRALVRRQLGGAIRRRRHAASLTLATVSERAGISVSMLSQVERGLLDPSLDTLRNIADALGTAPFRLLAEEGPVAGIVRRGERRIVADEAGNRPCRAALALGGGSVRDHRLGAAAGRLQARRRRAHTPARRRTCSSRARARLEIGDELIELVAGDCVTFDQRSPHRVTAVGREAADLRRGGLPARDLTRAGSARRLAFGSGGCDHV